MAYIIAEIGANHNGSMVTAQELVAEAAKAGADAVKFQSWTPESLYARQYLKENPALRDELIKHHLSIEKLKYLASQTALDFICSVFSNEEIDALEGVVDLYKVASMDITNHRLLKHLATKKKGIILSTGMATIEEIDDAVYILRRKPVTLLHCVSLYPPRYDQVNLKRMEELRKFNLPVGYSDHTPGIVVPFQAHIMGAAMIEKHFTLDKDLPGWDHKISATPAELAQLVRYIGIADLALRENRNQDTENREAMRRSLTSARDIYKGEDIIDKDVMLRRPGSGLQSLPRHATAARDIPAGCILARDDFE